MSSTVMAMTSPLGPPSAAMESAIATSSVPPNTAQIQMPPVNSSTIRRPDQQICSNYTFNRPCHVQHCRYYHDEVARQTWLNSFIGKRSMAQRARETPSMASGPTGIPRVNVQKSPGVQPVFTKPDTKKIPTSQLADSSTALTKTSPPARSSVGDGVRPYLRHKSGNSSGSSNKSDLHKMSFDEWNKNVAGARTGAAREVLNIETSTEATPVTVGKSAKNDENVKPKIDSGVEHQPTANSDKIGTSPSVDLTIMESQGTSNTYQDIRLQERSFSTTSNMVRSIPPTISHLKQSRFFKFQDIRLEEQESGAKITKIGTGTRIDFSDMKRSEAAVKFPNITSQGDLSSNESKLKSIAAANVPPYMKRSRFFNNQDIRLEDPSFVNGMRRADATLVITPALENLKVVHQTQDIPIEEQRSLDASKIAVTVPSISQTSLGSKVFENPQDIHVEQPAVANVLKTSPAISKLASIAEDSVAEDSVVEDSVAENPKVLCTDEDICIEQQPSLRNTKVARSRSISSTSTESSRALRKAQDISYKVLTFLHRRANSVSAPAPLGEGHPAYDGDAVHPRVHLPQSGHCRVDSNPDPPPLDQDHPAFDNCGAPRVSLPCALADTKVTPAVVHESKTPEKPNIHEMIGLSAWKNAALFIEASDRAQEKAEATTGAAVVPVTPAKFITKFIFRPVPQSPYGDTTSQICASNTAAHSITMVTAVPVIGLPVAEPVAEPIAELVDEPVAESVDELCVKPDRKSVLKLASESAPTVIQKMSDAPTNSASKGDDASTAVVSEKADTCKNFVRSRPCKHRGACPYYHDPALREAMVMNPCEGLLKPKSEKKQIVETPETHEVPEISNVAETVAVVAKYDEVPQQIPRCNPFILGYRCRHPVNEYYHDTSLRSAFHQAIRDKPHTCKNFLLGRNCASQKCKYYHDVVVRDSLNKIHSGPSISPVSNAHSVTPAAVDYGEFATVAKPHEKGVAVNDDTSHHQMMAEISNKLLPCKSFVLGYNCVPTICSYKHDIGLRSALEKLKRDVCKNYLLDIPCASRSSCKLYHDAELHDSLMAGYPSSHITGKASDSPSTCKDEKGIMRNDSPNRGRSPRPRSVSPENVALAAAWNDLTANAAVHDAEDEAAYASLRSSSAASGQDPYTLNTIYKDRLLKNSSISSAKARDTTIPSTVEQENDVADIKSPENLDVVVRLSTAEVPLPKVVGETAGNVSSATNNELNLGISSKQAMTAAIYDNDGAGTGKVVSMVAANVAPPQNMVFKLCPWFHGGGYECRKGDYCNYRHDHNLQQIYKSKDPRFQSQEVKATSSVSLAAKNCGEPKAITKWAKKTDESVWNSCMVPMAPPTKAKGKFVYFPFLPGEIRLKIWEYVLLTPYSPIIRQFFQDEFSIRPTAKYVNMTRTPVALRICHESRVEALKFYKLCLGSVSSPARTFLDYSTSYVYLCTRRSGYFRPMMKGLAPQDLSQIRHLTLKLRDWFCNDDVEFRDAIWRFKGLKTLQLLVSALKVDAEMRSKEAVRCVRACLKWDVKVLNPGWRTPRVVVAAVPGLEADSDPEEYAGPSTRGERVMEFRYEMQLREMYSSAI